MLYHPAERARAPLLRWLSHASALLCLGTGIAIFFRAGEDGIPGDGAGILVWLSILGAMSLSAAAEWQARAPAQGRSLALAVLAALAAGYTVANVIGTNVPFGWAPRAFHVVGIALGAAAFALALVELIALQGRVRYGDLPGEEPLR